MAAWSDLPALWWCREKPEEAGQEHTHRRVQVLRLPQAVHLENRNHLRGQPYSDAGMVAGYLSCNEQQEGRFIESASPDLSWMM